MNVAYPGLRAAIRAERRSVARTARRSALESVASGRLVLAINVYGCLFAAGALVNNVVAFMLLHMSPVWASYIPIVLVSTTSTQPVMRTIEHHRRERAARGEV